MNSLQVVSRQDSETVYSSGKGEAKIKIHEAAVTAEAKRIGCKK